MIPMQQSSMRKCPLGLFFCGLMLIIWAEPIWAGNITEPICLLELMFVVDTTSSQQPVIEVMVKAIEYIAERAHDMPGVVKVGVLGYRDYIRMTDQYHQLIHIIHHEMRDASVSCEDYPEAMFDGIYAAITATNWDKEKSSLRVIILIADAPGHAEGDEKNPMNYSLQGLINLASDNRVRFLCLQIATEASDNMDVLLEQQFKALAAGRTEGDRGDFFKMNLRKGFEFTQQLISLIERELEMIQMLLDVHNQ